MFRILITILISLILTISASSATKKVHSLESLQEAINTAQPGDRIKLANGKYITTDPITIYVTGTKELPVIIEAETPAGAEIAGTHGFHLIPPAEYIIIKGFRLTHSSGRFSIEAGVTNCIVTNNVLECSPGPGDGSKPYLKVSGNDNEIRYNTFRNKKDEGQMLSVQGPGADKMSKRVWIHHNYFHDFRNIGLNNCSAIQIGLSGRSMDSAFCLIEYNLFERTEGENEGAICHKSSRNIIRFNTFGERSEECSIRHGNKSEVYGNFFMNTTGLRFSGDDHLIYGNYFQGCSKAIVCQNGDGEVNEGSKLTCHDRADRVKIINNVILDCKTSYQMAERKEGLGATGIVFMQNLIRGGSPVSIKGIYPDAYWRDNIIWNTEGGNIPGSGFTVKNITIKKPGQLKWRKAPGFPEIPSSNHPMKISAVGYMASGR